VCACVCVCVRVYEGTHECRLFVTHTVCAREKERARVRERQSKV